MNDEIITLHFFDIDLRPTPRNVKYLLKYLAPDNSIHFTVAIDYDDKNKYMGWFFRDSVKYTPLAWAYLPFSLDY